MKFLRRALLLFVTIAVTVVGGIYGLGRCVFSEAGYEGPVSDHFDGKHFRNLGGPLRHGSDGFWKWTFTRRPGPWPDWDEGMGPGAAPPRVVEGGHLRVTFVNHASVLIQMDGVNVLTDPMYSKRASPVSWAGPKRRRPPGIRFEDMPRLDAVVMSHNHYDHLDLPTLGRLAAAMPEAKFFVGLGNAALLQKNGVGRARDFDWWQEAAFPGDVKLTFVPARHFSARGFSDRDKTLWGGWVLSGPSGSVYFAGDTGMGPHFAQIQERFPKLRLAILPIGAFLPRWFMSPVHVSPAEAVEAARLLGVRHAMPMHFGTFPLGDDGRLEPVEELKKALAAAPAGAPAFEILEEGQGWDVPE